MRHRLPDGISSHSHDGFSCSAILPPALARGGCVDNGAVGRNLEPGGADETRYRANLLIPGCDADYR